MVLRSEISGATLVRFKGRWNAETFVTWCRESGVTVSSLVPAQVHDLISAGLACPSTMRLVVVGGGVLNADFVAQARALGWPVVPSYGMTETCSQVATGDGLPLLPGWKAKIVNGRLALKGGGLLTAIIRRKEDDFFAEDPKIDGWYISNDRCELTERGLRFLGRADRLVKILGELVDLEELESFWHRKLGCEVALITRSDKRRGVNLFLFYEGAEVDVAVWNASLPGPERIAGATSVRRLPRSDLGKIDRSVLSKFHTN